MKNYIPYIIIIAMAVALLLSVQRCAHNARNGADNMAAVTDTVKYYTNALGTQTASIKTLQVDKASLKALLLDKDAALAALAKEFSKVHTVVKIESKFQIDSIPVPYAVPVPCVFERSGRVTDKWYSFGYTSNQDGFKIDSLQVPVKLTVITGAKRKWFLGKETVTTDVTADNPNIKVTGITAAEISVPVPWYKKWYVWLAAGVIGGGFIMK